MCVVEYVPQSGSVDGGKRRLGVNLDKENGCLYFTDVDSGQQILIQIMVDYYKCAYVLYCSTRTMALIKWIILSYPATTHTNSVIQT